MSGGTDVSTLPSRSTSRGVTFVALLIAQMLWISWYSPSVFLIIGGIKTQVGLLALWGASIALLSPSGARIALGRLRTRGAELALLALFITVNIAYLVVSHGDAAYDLLVRSTLIFAIGVTAFVHLTGDFRCYAQVGIVMTLVNGSIALAVLPLLYLTPGIARHYQYATGDVVWFGSWGFFMSYAMTIPSLITIARYQRTGLRWLMYTMCAAMSATILYSTFATPILLLFLGLGGMLVLSIRRVSTAAVFLVASLFVGVALIKLDVSHVSQLDIVRNKIKGIFSMQSNRLLDDPNNPQVRAHLTAISASTFVRYPLFGVGAQRPEKGDLLVGNHSGIVDGLAEFGVIGLSPYLLFLGVAVRRLVRSWRTDPANPILQSQLVMFGLYSVGTFVNPGFFDPEMTCRVLLLALSPVYPPALRKSRQSLVHPVR